MSRSATPVRRWPARVPSRWPGSTPRVRSKVRFPRAWAPRPTAAQGNLRLSTRSNVCILTDYPFTPGGRMGGGRFRLPPGPGQGAPCHRPARRHPAELGYQQTCCNCGPSGSRGWQSPALHRCAGGASSQAGARGERNHPDCPRRSAMAGRGMPLICGAVLGLLTSGRQAWQTRATIAGPCIASPEPASHLAAGAALLGGPIPQPDALRAAGTGLKLGTVLQQQGAEQGACATVLAASAGIITSFWVLAAMSSLLRATHKGAVGWGSSSRAPPFHRLHGGGDPAVLRQPAGAVRIKVAQQSQHSPRHPRRQGARRSLPAAGVSPHPARDPLLGPLRWRTAVAFLALAALGQLWPIFTAPRPWHEPALAAVGGPAAASLWLPKPRWMG